MPPPNNWDCRNGLVLFEFGGETFHRAGLVMHSPLLHHNMDKAMVLPRSPQPSSFSEYPHGMLLLADHGDDALCCHVDICTWESDNKVAAFVCVLRFGS